MIRGGEWSVSEKRSGGYSLYKEISRYNLAGFLPGTIPQSRRLIINDRRVHPLTVHTLLL